MSSVPLRIALMPVLITVAITLVMLGQARQHASSADSPSGPGQRAAAAAAAGTDWPLFGRVPERTHAIAGAPDPPFHYLWEFFAHQLIEFPPALDDGVLYVVNKTGDVYAVGAASGKVLWRRNLGRDITGPVYAGDTLYLAEYDGDLAALDPRTGARRWSFHAPARLESSPLVASGTVYFGSDSGELWALDAGSGKFEWRRDLGAPVKASPSFHDGVVFVGDYAGTIHAVTAAGKPVWELDTTEAAPGDGGFYSSPAIADGRVYEGRTDGTLVAATLGGKPAWHFHTNGAIYGSPAVGDAHGRGQTVFIGSYDHHLYALDAASGRRRWSFDVGGEIPGSPTVVGDTVYTSSFQTSRTTGLDAGTGRPVFHWGSAGYDPVISDGKRVFLTGYQTVWAFDAKR